MNLKKVNKIKQVVEDYYGIDLLEKNRSQYLVHARVNFVMLCLHFTDITNVKLSEFMGFDYTLISHYCKKFYAKKRNNGTFENYEELHKIIENKLKKNEQYRKDVINHLAFFS